MIKEDNKTKIRKRIKQLLSKSDPTQDELSEIDKLISELKENTSIETKSTLETNKKDFKRI